MSQFIEMFFKNTWKEKHLEDVVSEDCSLSYGIVQPGEGVEDGIPVVRPVDLVSDIVEPDCLKKTTVDIANSYKRTTLKGGELLLCVRGTTGLLSMASNRLNGGNVTRGIVPIWFKKDISKAFMFHQMKSDYVQTQIKENTYGTTLLQINIKDLRKIKVILPPEDLQLKFVSFAKQADKSEFDGFKSQFIEMSKHICINSKLGDLFCFIRNGANIKQGLNTGGIPITRIETIADGFVDRSRMGYAGIEDDTYSGYYLQNNDILMSHINSMKHIGKSAIYHREGEEKIIHGMNLLCLRVKEDAVNPIYVLYLLRSDSLRSLIRSISKQAVNQASFTVSDLKDIKLTLPPRPVQNEFETIVKQADKSEFELRKSIEAIDNVIKSLIN